MYGQTWADLDSTPRHVSWRMLRELRASPPGRAGSSDRRPTFAMALEQAEQLFTAAANVGPATRPLLAFYGLSQAGRALAAARAESPWKLSGHGISLVALRHRSEELVRLADVQVKPRNSDKDGSFIRVSQILSSSSFPGETRLGDLWTLIPDSARFPLPGSGDIRTLGLELSPPFAWTELSPVVGRINNIPGYFLTEGSDEVRATPASGVGSDWARQSSALRVFLDRYPTLIQGTFTVPEGQSVGLQPMSDGTCSVNLRWPDVMKKRYVTPDRFRDHLSVTYAGHTRVYPKLGGEESAVHPLLLWWAVLFGLSMLARYEPNTWGQMIDVNRSGDAAPVEHLLEDALTSLPELIHRCLTAEGEYPTL